MRHRLLFAHTNGYQVDSSEIPLGTTIAYDSLGIAGTSLGASPLLVPNRARRMVVEVWGPGGGGGSSDGDSIGGGGGSGGYVKVTKTLTRADETKSIVFNIGTGGARSITTGSGADGSGNSNVSCTSFSFGSINLQAGFGTGGAGATGGADGAGGSPGAASGGDTNTAGNYGGANNVPPVDAPNAGAAIVGDNSYSGGAGGVGEVLNNNNSANGGTGRIIIKFT